ncbi:hypothetical protein PV08_02828 [Exophiala spinifera]|uniref:FAD-binding domain-containing protein n=1 Tax=Exophiala spinifera TaxID=91928 RepID=A0A0D2BJ05_9EURO|nr:uncharacterized protein PV08_02828 [Exophiala spinifera]KIW18540.1 hypothetical protein PV08_02828 [Exophiala spinifera]
MPPLHVGIVGGGLGGMATACAVAKAGLKVTVLEQAEEVKEIGAGIQMTPNVSRFLIRWGVDQVLGNSLVEFDELNLRKKDGTLIGHLKVKDTVRRQFGFPWWTVHRMHLLWGFAEVAESEGVETVLGTRIEKIDWTSSEKVKVTSTTGKQWEFDLVIGADGVNSAIRKNIMPEVKPKPPNGNCAYRATVPYDQIRQDPVSKELVKKVTMEVWMAPKSYIISYPMSAATIFNMVLSHHVDHLVEQTEDIDMEVDFRQRYADYDPRIKRVVDMVPEARRWPLLVTGPLKSWSTPQKNVVLLGDAAHSMVNHMAQGAATAIEDGAFLAKTLSKVVDGKLSLAEAIKIYEDTRMDKVAAKQRVSYLNGFMWQIPEGELTEARNKAMSAELRDEFAKYSSNLWKDPDTTSAVYGYDAERDADMAIDAYITKSQFNGDVTQHEVDKYIGWWWPAGRKNELQYSKL